MLNTALLSDSMENPTTDPNCDQVLRDALEANGQRFTEQRAAVYRFLAGTKTHPTAEDVFLNVRSAVPGRSCISPRALAGEPGISLATVYKSLETLVGCGLARKLSHADGSARYDGRTDPHYHARCVSCGKVTDITGQLDELQLDALADRAGGFSVVGYHLELTGYCVPCSPAEGSAEA